MFLQIRILFLLLLIQLLHSQSPDIKFGRLASYEGFDNNLVHCIFQDKTGCSITSSAQIFVVNKTGYASPVSVPWP